MYQFKGKWIVDPRFLELEPINVFHKEGDKSFVWEHPLELQGARILVRYDLVCNPAEVDDILLYFSADDFAKIKINGKTITYGPAQGYFFHYYYNRLSIKQYLNKDKNLIEAEVLYQGLINRYTNSGDLRMGFIADIVAVKNGEELLITCTKEGEGWKYTSLKSYEPFETAGLIGYETQLRENYDARLEPTNDDFVDCVFKETDHVIKEECVEKQLYEISCGKGEKLDNGGIFYDLGQEVTGMLKLTARGKAGSKIRILCGEECDDSPERTRYKMRCNCRYEEFFTLKEGVSELEQFDYKAFRYITLIPEEGAEILQASVLVRHFPFDDNACTIETNDEILNQVFAICKNAVKYGSQDSLIDCPSREKGSYSGDLTVSGPSWLWLTGDPRQFKKGIEDEMLSSYVCPGLLSVFPGSVMQEIADYSLEFPLHALKYYEFTKDSDFLSRAYKIALGMIKYYSKYEREDGLITALDEKGNIVDWPPNYLDGYDAEGLGASASKKVSTIPHNVLNSHYIGLLMGAKKMADFLGENFDIDIQKYVDTFNRVFFNKETGLYVDAEGSTHSALHSNVIPLFYGITPKECEQKVADFVVEKKLACGVLPAYFYLKALARIGRYEDVYNTLVLTDNQCWYNMVREGATTCYEAWGKDQKWNTSLCHPFASAPVSVFFEDVLGLNLDGTRGESHLPKGITAKVRTPMHGELIFN